MNLKGFFFKKRHNVDTMLCYIICINNKKGLLYYAKQ